MTLLGVALGRGSGRARYAVAMGRYHAGELSADELEAYRIASAEDFLGPEVELQKIGASVAADPKTKE